MTFEMAIPCRYPGWAPAAPLRRLRPPVDEALRLIWEPPTGSPVAVRMEVRDSSCVVSVRRRDGTVRAGRESTRPEAYQRCRSLFEAAFWLGLAARPDTTDRRRLAQPLMILEWYQRGGVHSVVHARPGQSIQVDFLARNLTRLAEAGAIPELAP